ncbi:MAG: TIGR03936 family radical SAM-associated protein [Spirochaetes bacterium]|nr:TIGR03936 family radical SAM-associated protein [Spirochaetota bacterium]
MFSKIEADLIHFEKPARYIGNEFGIPQKDFIQANVRFAISYPDVYEVGMSNQGIKILYDIINQLEFAACERVFSPWQDFEKYLREKNYPLFSLESKSPLQDFDFLGFSLQYELLFSNLLNIIDLARIPIMRSERGEKHPLVICGGPVTVNPLPFAPFVDIFCIGEAEEVIPIMLSQYQDLKKTGGSRKKILQNLDSIDGLYIPGISQKAVKRQIYMDFSHSKNPENLITPHIDIIQNKLVVEIMRGCPNKCRFCEAGVIYKPYRERDVEIILEAIDHGIEVLGVDEVTLSSLSSGDYSCLFDLLDILNKKYQHKKISFSLPSLKVESFNPELLEKLSFVRKSGLTFAVETGSLEGQKSINKPVLMDKVNNIIDYAVNHGWRLIKLYFMIGLPHVKDESEKIIDFLDNIKNKYQKLKINVNLGVFVPKPHTPYQYEPQMSLEKSIAEIAKIKEYFRKTRVKIKEHDPYMSYLEGLIARGDEKIGLMVYQAFKNGARFDGWDNLFQFSYYQFAMKTRPINATHYIGIHKKGDLPWQMIDIGLNESYLLKENWLSQKQLLTKNCKNGCEDECTICKNLIHKINAQTVPEINLKELDEPPPEGRFQYFIQFSKKSLFKYLGHLDLLSYFERLFRKSGIKLKFTEGFNPHPKLQFTPPLALGIESDCEILEFYTTTYYQPESILESLKKIEHSDLKISEIMNRIEPKKISLINHIFSSDYVFFFNKIYYNKIKVYLDLLTEKSLEYQIERKGKRFRGNYQDCIHLLEVTEHFFRINVKMLERNPKIWQFKNDLLGDIPVSILKKQLFVNEGRQTLLDYLKGL